MANAGFVELGLEHANLLDALEVTVTTDVLAVDEDVGDSSLSSHLE